MFCTRCFRATVTRRPLPLLRQFTTTSPFRNASAEPPLSTPVTAAGETPVEDASARSICPAGTVLTGLSYSKTGQDPVAKKDEEYPEWLWSCLDVLKKSADAGEDDMGDEFSKSKKQRKLATKRRAAHEAKLMAEGNLEALAPKIPLQHQSINLPGEEGQGVDHNIEAAEKRDELKKAMRQERKAKIKANPKHISIMSGQSKVGNSGVYEAGDQRNSKDSEVEQPEKFHEGKEHAHNNLDSKDERSIANRLAAEEANQGEEEDPEITAMKKDPTAPARMHGNEPSRGAKIDAQILADEEAELERKGKK